jgi:hypothetical protein
MSTKIKKLVSGEGLEIIKREELPRNVVIVSEDIYNKIKYGIINIHIKDNK